MDIDEIIRRGQGLPAPGPQQVTVSAPINDVQLVCLIAGALHKGDTKQAVEDAIQVMAEAVARAAAGDLVRIIDEARQSMTRENES